MKDKVVIRSCKLEDIKECVKLSKIPELRCPDGDYPPKVLLKSIIKGGQIFLVAEINGKIVGYRMGEKLQGYLGIAHLIVVKKEYQDKGIGRMLLKAFEKECKKRGIRWLITYAYANNKKTLKFFKKNGYYQGSLTYEFVKILK